MKKYGAESPLGSTELRDKFIKTMIEKYGVDNPSKSETIKDKVKKTKIKMGYTFDDSDWNIFKKMVRIITQKESKNLLNNWNGFDYYDNEYIKNNFKLHHNEKNYPTIDHKISIIGGYKLSIPPEIIGGINNLCYTKRSINSKKNYKNENDFSNNIKT